MLKEMLADFVETFLRATDERTHLHLERPTKNRRGLGEIRMLAAVPED